MAIVKPFNPRWRYSGDMNLEHGGLFWRPGSRDPFPEADYVEAVQVTPCTDAGGPDNLFCIESGSIYMPRDGYETALDSCGYTLHVTEYGTHKLIDASGARLLLNSGHGLALLVDAFWGYGGMERDAMNGERYVQIGRPDRHHDYDGPGWHPDPDYILPGNSKLSRFVRREFL